MMKFKPTHSQLDTNIILAFIMCKVLGEGKDDTEEKINRAYFETQERINPDGNQKQTE